jgi:hypothetical protein
VNRAREIYAIATSVTCDGLPQIDIKEAMQGAPQRSAIRTFGWVKPPLADERLDFALTQLDRQADELVGASVASEALAFGGQHTLRSA